VPSAKTNKIVQHTANMRTIRKIKHYYIKYHMAVSETVLVGNNSSNFGGKKLVLRARLAHRALWAHGAPRAHVVRWAPWTSWGIMGPCGPWGSMGPRCPKVPSGPRGPWGSHGTTWCHGPHEPIGHIGLMGPQEPIGNSIGLAKLICSPP